MDEFTSDEQGLITSLRAIVGDKAVRAGSEMNPDDLHDESLGTSPGTPVCVIRPTTTEHVSHLARRCFDAGVAMVARGSGTGLSGAASAPDGAVIVAFDQMNEIIEIDEANHVAVVQPGVTLAQLDDALTSSGLFYPIHPGERGGSIGGNVATNAGGMRAVRDGVTRHHVLGVEMVLADGTVLRHGGKFVKSSTGLDLTQLIIGSEGSLGFATEIVLRLSVRRTHSATLLAPFRTLEEVAQAIPSLVATGLEPAVLEYLDLLTMASITQAAGIDLGLDDSITATALAYLVIVLESTTSERVDDDLETVATLLGDLGALDTFVLPSGAGAALIDAREQAFYVAKANGATDIIDVVVPRAQIPEYLAAVAQIAADHSTFVAGCGHAGDGNVHLSIFETDATARHELLMNLFRAGIALGGTISGEHGIGTLKRAAYRELTDPALQEIEARIKQAFDPKGLMNPERIDSTNPRRLQS